MDCSQSSALLAPEDAAGAEVDYRSSSLGVSGEPSCFLDMPEAHRDLSWPQPPAAGGPCGRGHTGRALA